MTVIATAGHVDHGKSTLVRALTGTDPDRWAEEKERGLTIDLGFASTTLPSGRALSLVDVPGHIRFLRNMLSGVGAVDGCLFVVAATEGWKPQSEEHLRILDLLGLTRGVVALTKVDLVDDDLRELAQLDVEEHVAGTFLDGAEIIAVAAGDGPDGEGIDTLKASLDRLAADAETRVADGTPRLWVDRAFAPPGVGAVVTGTLTGGAVAVGDELAVSSAASSADTIRIRGIQNHHRDLDRVEAGNRVALNLVGVSHRDVARGDVLVAEEAWHHSAMVDAELTVLEGLDHPVTRRGAYAAYIGSGEFPCRLRVLADTEAEPGAELPTEIAPGATGNVRLYLSRAIPLTPGDRFILRESGRHETVGGGRILDVDPVLPATKARPDDSVERIVAERGWVDVDQLRRLTGTSHEPTIGRWVVHDGALAELAAEVEALVTRAGPLGLDLASLNERQRTALEAIETVRIDQGRAVVGPVVDPLADHPWVASLAAAPFTPPGPDGVDRNEIRELVRRGLVVEQDGIYFAQAAIDEARSILREAFTESDGLTVAEIRDLLGTTRKYVLALLAHLDGNGMTRRRDDLRIPGPRL
ncbi:MAG: selenocysteine-specific translation elongation factor [Acidimicrobiia bacterium]|nr:selenocysteine-specific translation elongation factor [Acidimicrobiia bacterium]